MNPTNTISIPRFFPLGDMALSFDGTATVAQATLAEPTNWPGGFSLTFWINVAAAVESPQCVVEVYSQQPSGVVAYWSVDSDLMLSCMLNGTKLPAAELSTYRGQWVFAATVYTPPDGDQPGSLTLAVSDGSPVTLQDPVKLVSHPAAGALGQILMLGASSGLAMDYAPFQGMITRIRLWSVPLTAPQLTTEMYDYPIGWKAAQAGSMISDWRISEGYGDVAFDYASAGGEFLPRRYEPPPGNHMMLGTGVPGTEPAWVIADLVTLVHYAATVPVSLVTTTGLARQQ